MLGAVVTVLLMTQVAAQSGDRLTGGIRTTRSEVIARNGMAATSHPLATQIALDLLKRGGSAVDAAIGANAALALMEPVSCGLGGDLFAIVWDEAEGKLHGLNASGRSPQGLTLEILRDQGHSRIPARGPLAVSVPGAVDGWFELHQRFGRLPMSQILEPVIRYARDGVPVPPVIAYYWKASEFLVKECGNFGPTFLPGGRAPAVGEVFRNPDLARTLEILAAEGRDGFYRGTVARAVDAYCRRVGCYLRWEDLAEHQSEWVDPVNVNYRGYDVWELPPNGQGIAVLQMLNLLEGFDLRSMGHNSARYLHHLVEAKKLAFEDRARYYADPAFSPVPVAQLISKAYADQRRRLILPEQAGRSYPSGDPLQEEGDTIYLTVADRDRNMVSLIQSNFMGFGSGLVPDGTGFGLQNRGCSFTLEEGQFNTFAPRKRPFHTIIPGFVTRQGRPFLSFGVMGGDMQPQGHVQVLCNIIDFGMTIQEAGDAPRFRHFGSTEPTGGSVMQDGGAVALETGVPAESTRELLKMRHDVRFDLGGFGGYQAILYDPVQDVYWGASESRKDGMAAGY